MATETPTAELLRRRFHECQAEERRIRERVAPVRAEYEAAMKEIQGLEAIVKNNIEPRLKEAEAGLYEITNEAAAAARALRDPVTGVSKMGDPPADLDQ